MSRCRSCGAEIIWAITVKDKLMPLNADPDPNGNIGLVELHDGPVATVVGPLFDEPRYMPHHATCPQADQWRKL